MFLRLPIEQINGYTAYKQHLTPTLRGSDVVSVAQKIGPLRATPTVVPYLSLWARMPNLRHEQVEAALYQDRSLVRIPAMQAKLYMVPTAHLAAYFQVTKPCVQEYVDGILSGSGPCAQPELDRVELIQRIMEVLSTRGPQTVEEMTSLLPALGDRTPFDPDQPELGESHLGAELVSALCAQGLLIRAQTRESWRSGLYSYTSLSSWLPGLDMIEMPPDQALQQVIRAYLAAFGPVTVGDLTHWLGGIPRRQVVTALMKMDDQLVRLQIHGLSGEYYLLAGELPALLGYATGERYANLLPSRDSYPTAYSETNRFLAAVHRDRIWDRVGEALGTAWVDGRIVGTWWLQMREERVVVRFFEMVDSEALALVGEEARRLGPFMGFDSLDVDIDHYLGQDMDDEESGITFAHISLN